MKAIFVLISIVCVSCVFSANMRYYLKDNIQFSAPLNTNSSRKYNSLQIGTPEQPYYKNPPNFVFLLNEKIIRSDSINVADFRSLHGVKETSEYVGDKWPPGTIHYYYSGYGILVFEGQILQFYAVKLNSASENTPQIALKENSTLYPLPITEKVVLEFFGKEDKFHDFFMH